MYCTDCGFEISEAFRYCPQCGALRPEMAGTPDPAGVRRLRRPIEGKKIAGVCAAFARYLNLDVTLVRIVIAMLAVYPVGLGVIFYIIAWIAIPQEPWAPPAVVMHQENPAGAPGA